LMPSGIRLEFSPAFVVPPSNNLSVTVGLTETFPGVVPYQNLRLHGHDGWNANSRRGGTICRQGSQPSDPARLVRFDAGDLCVLRSSNHADDHSGL
jgi:hypothetical protein